LHESCGIFGVYAPDNTSKSDRCRYQLIGEVNAIYKINSLGVSLRTMKRLWTPYHPANPINFWNYEPQGDYDKAPVKA